jgi:hypothetical protein
VPQQPTSVSASADELPQCNVAWAWFNNSPFSPTARSGQKVRKCYCLGIGEQMNLNRSLAVTQHKAVPGKDTEGREGGGGGGAHIKPTKKNQQQGFRAVVGVATGGARRPPASGASW